MKTWRYSVHKIYVFPFSANHQGNQNKYALGNVISVLKDVLQIHLAWENAFSNVSTTFHVLILKKWVRNAQITLISHTNGLLIVFVKCSTPTGAWGLFKDYSKPIPNIPHAFFITPPPVFQLVIIDLLNCTICFNRNHLKMSRTAVECILVYLVQHSYCLPEWMTTILPSLFAKMIWTHCLQILNPMWDTQKPLVAYIEGLFWCK